MTRGHRAVMRPNIRDWFAIVGNAVEEVGHMTAGLLSVAKFDDDFIEFLAIVVGQTFDWAAFQFSAVDENPALITFKQNSIPKIAAIDPSPTGTARCIA